MSIQDEFQAAGEEYARRLEKQQTEERLEALRIEARHHGNAAAFAQFVEASFGHHDTDLSDTNTQENQ